MYGKSLLVVKLTEYLTKLIDIILKYATKKHNLIKGCAKSLIIHYQILEVQGLYYVLTPNQLTNKM